MSVSGEYFKAEVFSRIFLSGPLGRVVALLIMAGWAVRIAARGAWKIFTLPFAFWKPAKSSEIAGGFRGLQKAVRDFGDEYRDETFLELLDTNAPSAFRAGRKWRYCRIFGTGWRTGEFELAVLCHVPSGGVRIFLSRNQPTLSGEIPPEEIGTILENRAFGACDVERFYRILRKNYL
jgi:hypothetical protein